MGLKDEWKQTGKGLGTAFKELGKTISKSAKYIVNKADEKINSEDYEEKPESTEKESTVFNDGSWRNTGKDLGKAFAGLGKTIGDTVSEPFKDDNENKKDD